MKALPAFFGLIFCLTFISAYAMPLLALSKRPPVPHDEQGNFVPNPFAEADALRYGGLFGPLPDPYEDDLFNNFYGYAPDYKPMIDVRGMGFSVDEGHYIPITRVRSTSGSS